MRLGKFLLSIGVVLGFISILGSPPIGDTTTISNTGYQGIMFRATTDMIIQVEVKTQIGNISFWILDAEDTLETASNGNLSNTSPILEIREIRSYSGDVTFPFKGFYSIILSTLSQESIEVFVQLSVKVPHPLILISAIIFCFLGIVCILTKSVIYPKVINVKY